MYVPRGNKNEFNERQDSSTHRLSVPPALSRTEFPVHSALISKVPWPAAFPLPSTWISRATRLMCCIRRARRLDGTARPGPGETPTLRRRHTRPKAWPCCSLPATTRRASRRRHARPWCAAAPAVVAPAAGVGGSSGRGSGAWWWHAQPSVLLRDTAAPAHHYLAVCQVEREGRFQREARAVKAERLKSEARGEVWQPPPPPLSGPDALEMSRQVPALRTTTWSLAGF